MTQTDIEKLDKALAGEGNCEGSFLEVKPRIKPIAKFRDYDQYVVAAANKVGDTGVILVGARHWDPLMRAQWDAMKDQPQFQGIKSSDIKQGFIDNRRNFLTRGEAYALVIKTGQEVIGEDWDQLYSENLY